MSNSTSEYKSNSINMIPDASKKEWAAIISDPTVVKLFSLSLQMKVNALRLEYKVKHITIEQAVEELCAFCMKNEKMYEKDLSNIFKYDYILMSK